MVGRARGTALLVGLAVVGICARDWMDITDLVETIGAYRGRTIAAQAGFYLTVAGGVLVALSALLPARKR